MLRLVPIRRPFPDVANHVVNAVAVRREHANWRSAFVAVLRRALPRKYPLPGVGHVAIAGKELVAPGVGGAIESSTGRELPLGFRRQRLAFPSREGFGIAKRDVDDRVIVESVDRARGSVWMSPVRTAHPVPPIRNVPA